MDNEESAAVGVGPGQSAYSGTATERVLRLATVFQALDKGHHEGLHDSLAEAALIQKELIENPFEHALFLEKFRQKCPMTPRGVKTSHDVVYYATGATTVKAIRKAGTYAMAVDYVIAHEDVDYRSYLKRHTYTGVLEKAREEKRPGQRTRDQRPVVRVHLSGVRQEFVDFITNPPHRIEVDFRCVIEPGRKPKITATPTAYVELDPPGLTKAEQKLHRSRLRRVDEARSLLEDRMLYASGWPEPQDA